MNLEMIAHDEIKQVRIELQDLKRCQLQYFALSISAAGAILGLTIPNEEVFSVDPETNSNLAALGLLAPVFVLFPCWMIFFDKATTITRLVGYQRALERVRGRFGPSLRFLGLETALSVMRINEDALDRKLVLPTRWGFLRLLTLRTRNRYWMINWYTFFTISLVVCTLGYNFLGDSIQNIVFPFGVSVHVPERTLWGGGAFAGFVVVTAYTFRQVWKLTMGTMSYEAYESKWLQALAI